jgi:hypothetical protein
MYGQSGDLEDEPTREQKSRMDDFLYELKQISARYQIVLDTEVTGAGAALIDARTDKVIGVELGYVLDDENAEVPKVTGYDCMLSIADGVWLVKDGNGRMVEQGMVDGSLWPRRNIRR